MTIENAKKQLVRIKVKYPLQADDINAINTILKHLDSNETKSKGNFKE